jgi:hypothetical protein
MLAINWRKDLPDVGVFRHIRRTLEGLSFRGQIDVEFKTEVHNLGSSNDHDRTDVYAYNETGQIGGWRGSYGGSSAAMFACNGLPGQAAAGLVGTPIMPGCAILSVRVHYKGRWATIYLHPENKNLLLPKPELSERLQKILAVFGSITAAARKHALWEMQATTEELQELVSKDFLRVHKGRTICRLLGEPKFIGYGKSGEYNTPFAHPYDLGGAKITPEGKNACQGIRIY